MPVVVPKMLQKEKLYLLESAKLALIAKRYDDMAAAMKQIVTADVELNDQERSLLSVAYTNMLSAERYSWKIMVSFEARLYGQRLDMVRSYRKLIEQEIADICNDMLELLDKHLIKNASTIDAKIIYFMMKGDYYWHLAKIYTGEAKDTVANNSRQAFENATDMAKSHLIPSDPIRRVLAYKYCKFCSKILHQDEKASGSAGQVLVEANDDSNESPLETNNSQEAPDTAEHPLEEVKSPQIGTDADGQVDELQLVVLNIEDNAQENSQAD